MGVACFNGATCIDRVASFSCRCTPGKTGLLCHLDDACTSQPCHVDATCDTSPTNGSYTCSCASGYKGVDCSEDIDECAQGTKAKRLLLVSGLLIIKFFLVFFVTCFRADIAK